MGRLLILITAGLAAAVLFWAWQAGFGTPFWLACGAVVVSVLALLLALGANARLSRLRSDYAQLSAQFELAMGRLEKQANALQARLAVNEQAADSAKTPRRKSAPDAPEDAEAHRPMAQIIAHPKAGTNKTAAKPHMIEGGLAAAERLTRQRRAVERGFKKAVNTGQFPLCLQPVLSMPEGVPVAYIASARIADQDLPAFGEPGEGIDRSHYTDLMLVHALRAARQLADLGGADTPVICQLSLEFLLDSKRFGLFASAIEAQPQAAEAVVAALPRMSESETEAAFAALDRLARSGMRFAVCGNHGNLARLLKRIAAPVAYFFVPAKSFADRPARTALRDIAAFAGSRKAQLVAMEADSERLQLSLMEEDVRLVTSAAAAPPRLVKPPQPSGRQHLAG